MELKKKSRLPIYAGTVLSITALAMIGTHLLINRIADKSAPALALAPKAIDDSVEDSADDKVQKPGQKGPGIPGQFLPPGMKPPIPGMGVDDGGAMRRFGAPPGGKVPPGYSIKENGPPMYGHPPQGMPGRNQPMSPPQGMGRMPQQNRPAYPQQPPQPPPQMPQQQQQPQGYPPAGMGYPPMPYYPYGAEPPMGMPPGMGYPPPPYNEEDYYPDYWDEENYEGRNDDRRENSTAIGDVAPSPGGRGEDTQHRYDGEDDYIEGAFEGN